MEDGVADRISEAIELAVLRDVEHGAEISHEALAWEIPGADVTRVAAALHQLIKNGELRFSRGTRRPHTMELSLTDAGRAHLAKGT